MNKKIDFKNMTVEDMKKRTIEELKKLATPIDFEDLIAKGIIKKKGARYQVSDIRKLPDHVRLQIKEMKNNDGYTLIKFPTSWKRAQQIYRKATGKEYYE